MMSIAVQAAERDKKQTGKARVVIWCSITFNILIQRNSMSSLQVKNGFTGSETVLLYLKAAKSVGL